MNPQFYSIFYSLYMNAAKLSHAASQIEEQLVSVKKQQTEAQEMADLYFHKMLDGKLPEGWEEIQQRLNASVNGPNNVVGGEFQAEDTKS